ncbi:MAG TPA: hypothetical protein VIL71_06945, partial [Spirillospora sp.]
MTGDQGSGSGREKLRPSFLPPVDGYPPPPEETRDPVPAADGERRGGAVWTLATILSGAMLLVSAFLPWARVQVIVELFGRSLGRDLGSLAGIDADGLVLAVPVLATVAIGLAFWDLVAREARAGPLAAVPGMLALFVCGVFVVRLDDVRDNLPQTGLDFGYQISVRYGWYLAVVTSLLVAGFSLVRSIADRVSGPRGEPDARRPGRGWGEERYGQYTDQPYTDQPYTGQPYT